MYRSVLNGFLECLEHGSVELRARKVFLDQQHAFLDRIVNLVKTVAKESSNRKKKIEKFQSIILESEDSKEFNFNSFESIPFPLDPNIKINGILAKKTTLFKSSLMPAKITFTTEAGEEYVAIFKNGDDLRQDQLILQVCRHLLFYGNYGWMVKLYLIIVNFYPITICQFCFNKNNNNNNKIK